MSWTGAHRQQADQQLLDLALLVCQGHVQRPLHNLCQGVAHDRPAHGDLSLASVQRGSSSAS